MLTVTKATLTVTADDKSREYGDANPTFTRELRRLQERRDAGDSWCDGLAEPDDDGGCDERGGGSPYAITAALGTLASGNYSFSFVDGNLTITKATLTVTADNMSRITATRTRPFTASYSGFKNGETLATSRRDRRAEL